MTSKGLFGIIRRMIEDKKFLEQLKKKTDLHLNIVNVRELRQKIRNNGIDFNRFISDLIREGFKRPKNLRNEEYPGILGGNDETLNKQWENHRNALLDISKRCDEKGYVNIRKPSTYEHMHIRLDTANQDVNYLLKPVWGWIFVFEQWIKTFPNLMKAMLYILGLVSFAWLYNHMNILWDNLKELINLIF